ncbi:MAG: hypothetical protein R2867_16840 [Caldilineaceae bacterium]
MAINSTALLIQRTACIDGQRRPTMGQLYEFDYRTGGRTFACFQLESVVPDSIGAIQERDGLPIDIIFDTAPYGTSGLWVSMASHLLPNFVPTATPTVTNTPLPATATATATATNTPVTPVATATATATATNTPVVSGPTPTMTNTPVVSGPTLTPTVTKTPTSCTPSVTITITHKPNPAHPGQRLTYYINFQVNNCGVKGLTFHLTIPLHTEYTGDTSRMAGWQCTAATGGSSCDLAFGDLAPNGSSVLEFPVTVDSNTPLGTTLFLNVTATDADGNSHSGISGVDYNVTVEPVIIYIPVVNNTPR